MQFFDQFHFLTFFFALKIETINKVLLFFEERGHQKVKETPELAHIILERGARQHDPHLRAQFARVLVQFRAIVFELVCLIEEYYVKINLSQVGGADVDGLVRGQTHVILAWLHLIAENVVPEFLGWDQIDHAELRKPSAEFFHPIRNRRLRRHDQMRLLGWHVLVQIREKGDGLNCFTHTHIVGQNAIDPMFVEGDHPFQTLNLVRMEVAILTKASRHTVKFGISCAILILAHLGLLFRPDVFAL